MRSSRDTVEGKVHRLNSGEYDNKTLGREGGGIIKGNCKRMANNMGGKPREWWCPWSLGSLFVNMSADLF